MDWDDLKPKPQRSAVLGENLDAFSVAELEARIEALRNEIARIDAELERKRRHSAAADALFAKRG